MTTSYPGALDALTNPSTSDKLDSVTVPHAAQHANANDAIEAIQAELGTDPSGASATVAARFTAIEGGALTVVDAKGDLLAGTAPDTVARLAVGTVGQLLGVDATAATGLAWRSPGATNLLTANQASLETDTTGWEVNQACTIARSTAQAAVGSASLLVTATETWAANAVTLTAGAPPVVPGRLYTLRFSARDGVGTRSAAARIYWFTAADAFISTSDSSAVTLSASAWTPVQVSAVAPATAAYARVSLNSGSGSVSDTIFIDAISLHEGYSGDWALPGSPIQNQGVRWSEAVGRTAWAWDTVNAREQLVYGDTGWRDVSAATDAAFQASNPAVTLRLRRVGSLVEWDLEETAGGTGSGTVSIYSTIPSGFRPVNLAAVPCISGATGLPLNESVYTSSPTMYGFGWTGAVHLCRLVYSTTDAWPSSLPGTASGAIPFA